MPNALSRAAVAHLLVAGAALAGCASNPDNPDATRLENGGIRTAAIAQAPAAQAAADTSQPLSALSTPDAIAAREAARPKAVVIASAAPASAATGKPGSRAAVPALPAAPVGLTKGAVLAVRAGAVLRARPDAAAAAAPLPAGARVQLDTRIYNASGYWWYASAGGETGWLAQDELRP